MWPEADRWRAPVNDFPPRWANAWGDDQYGLWADLTVNGVTQCMRWIEPGEFVMGSSDDERRGLKEKALREWADQQESPQHTVEISNGFWLADTPCTQAFWAATTGKNPSRFHEGDKAPQRPVEQVSWNDVMAFTAQLESLVPEASAMLPTDAQWEYACRAGTQTAYWWGNEANSARANWAGELGQTSPVKSYQANPWGLFDVHGNVWEWCADARRSFDRERQLDPNGGVEGEGEGGERVVRGGSWGNSAGGARSAYRSGFHRSYDLSSSGGFRLALRSPSLGGGAAGR
jgi:formylglycine-generating enzyme